METFICAICFCEFVPYRKTQKYCSGCRKIAIKEYKRTWYVKVNPNAYAPKEEKKCVACGEPFRCHFEGRPYCNKHYLKMKFYGTIEKISRYRNTIVDNGNHCEIITSKGETIIVDKNDLEVVQSYSWCIDKRGYVVARIDGKVKTIHRHILGLKDSKISVDHINGNKLDNTRSNLRACEQKSNSRNLKKKKTNTSGYPGVRMTEQGKYNARIMVS